MPIYAQINDDNIVFAVTVSGTAPVGNFVVSDTTDVLGWISNNGVLEEPPFVQQYKRDGLTRTEWIGLFSEDEQILHTKTRALINDMSADFSYLSGGHLMDVQAVSIGRPNDTYRDLMRNVFFHFESAAYPPGISVNSPNVARAMAVQVILGLLTQARSNEILLGMPL